MGKMELDLSSYWVPFTPNRHFKSAPRILASAKDMHFTTDDGRQLLDVALYPLYPLLLCREGVYLDPLGPACGDVLVSLFVCPSGSVRIGYSDMPAAIQCIAHGLDGGAFVVNAIERFTGEVLDNGVIK